MIQFFQYQYQMHVFFNINISKRQIPISIWSIGRFFNIFSVVYCPTSIVDHLLAKMCYNAVSNSKENWDIGDKMCKDALFSSELKMFQLIWKPQGNEQVTVTTLQSMMNTKLIKQRFWHCYENGLIKTIQTIPHSLYVSIKLIPLYCGLGPILVYPNSQ